MEKLKSRKLWAAIVGIIVGVASIFGLDENIIAQVSGYVVAGASVVTYILAEASVDKAGASAPAGVIDKEAADE